MIGRCIFTQKNTIYILLITEDFDLFDKIFNLKS